MHVTDKDTGQPIEAVVTFKEIALKAQERWTTRPDNGWFHHILPAAGVYTVQVETKEKSVSQSVSVAEGVTRLELKL